MDGLPHQGRPVLSPTLGRLRRNQIVGPLGLELAGNHTLFIRISQWLNGAYPGWYPKVDHASRAAYNLHEIRCEVHCYTVR